jgi:glycosyltransferase involved in cell wall biosynthesis
MRMFSVIIPAHNEEKDIGKCLDRLLGQDCEVIVVNDGSTDYTENIARRYMVRVISFRDSHSPAFSRNIGAMKSKGKYLVFIDADMYVPDDLIEKLKERIPFAAMSFHIFSESGNTFYEKAWESERKYIDKMFYPRGIHCIRKDLFKKIGMYDEHIFYYEDMDLIERFNSAAMHSYPSTDDENYVSPSDIVVTHKETENLSEFKRQREYQAKGIISLIKFKGNIKSLRYFLPCFFPPYMIFSSMKAGLRWGILDMIGRYISLIYLIRNIGG